MDVKKFKCRNCGGEFEIHTHGELLCPFCGSKQYFSDSDFKGYDDFRDSLLRYLKNENDRVLADGDVLNLWDYNKSVGFETEDGDSVEIKYTFHATVDGVEVYISRDNAVYVFEGPKRGYIKKMFDAIEQIDYPSADVKNLREFLPQLNMDLQLKDSKELVAFSKPENVYPLFAFSNLGPRHVAWIISRMENFCCLLEFNNMDFEHMDPACIYINPKTHEAYLIGGWWATGPAGEGIALSMVRSTAKAILGHRYEEGPQMFKEFLASKPKKDAYEDFAYWDSVIENGFGGHNFATFGKE